MILPWINSTDVSLLYWITQLCFAISAGKAVLYPHLLILQKLLLFTRLCKVHYDWSPVYQLYRTRHYSTRTQSSHAFSQQNWSLSAKMVSLLKQLIYLKVFILAFEDFPGSQMKCPIFLCEDPIPIIHSVLLYFP